MRTVFYQFTQQTYWNSVCYPTFVLFVYLAPAIPRRKPGESVVPFNCTVCGKSFRFHSQLSQHSRHHTGVRPYECNVCGQSFALQCSLMKHTTMHADEKPLMCDTCGQRFAHINYLKSHQRTHTHEQPYSCRVCNRSFTTAASLRHHTAVRHNTGSDCDDTNQRFTCHKCGNTFSSMASVRQHLRTHSGAEEEEDEDEETLKQQSADDVGGVSDSAGCHVCNVCGRLFTTIRTLRRHMAVHSEGKQHQCAVCGRRFMQLTNLKAHMRTHTSLGSAACRHCGREFSDQVTLGEQLLKQCPIADTASMKTDSVSIFDGVVTNMLNYGVVHNEDLELKVIDDDRYLTTDSM